MIVSKRAGSRFDLVRLASWVVQAENMAMAMPAPKIKPLKFFIIEVMIVVDMILGVKIQLFDETTK